MISSATMHKYVLVCSNVAYLIPAGVVLYKLVKPHGRRIDIFIGVELILVFLFVAVFTSTSYHLCRADLCIKEDIDPEEIKINSDKTLNPCLTCSSWVKKIPFSSTEVTYSLSKTYDHLFAMFVLLLVIINIIPLRQNFKQLIIIVSLLWMSTFLESGNDVVASLPVILVSILFFIFWLSVRVNISKIRVITWSLAMVTMVISFILYCLEPYWLMHSLWHIFGAITGALLLSQTAGCYENVFGKIVLPKFVKPLFKLQENCKVFDVK